MSDLNALLELERRGKLPPDGAALLGELRKRGLIEQGSAQEKPMNPAEGAELRLPGMDRGIPIPAQASEFLAGTGRRLLDIATLGLRNDEDTQSADKRLDQSGWATAGGVLADLASLPAAGSVLRGAAAIPTLAKAAPMVSTALNAAGNALFMPKGAIQGATAGAAWGAGTTNGNLADRATAGAGGAIGGAIPGLASGGINFARTALDPLTEAGQKRAAGTLMRSFAVDPKAAAANIRNAKPSAVGSNPTLAEVAQDQGVSRLQRTLMNEPTIGPRIITQMDANDLARLNAIQDIGGDAGKMALYQSELENVGKKLYGPALSAPIDPAAITPKLQAKIQDLLSRPAIKAAQADAQRIAGNEGIKLAEDGSIRGLHYLKVSLDDQIGAAKQAGKSNEVRILTSLKDDLLGVIEEIQPAYKSAREAYAEYAKPINQMKIGNALTDALAKPNAAGGQGGINPGRFGNALKDPDALARRATKFPGAKFEKTLTPEQQATVRAVQNELGALANVLDTRIPGSPTMANLASQNLLRQVLGPLGLPQTMAESAMLQTMLRPYQWATKVGEPRIMDLMAEAVQNPQVAAGLLSAPPARQLPPGLLPAFGTAGVSVGPTLLNSRQ